MRPFTSRTRVALAIARGIAAARGDPDLTPTHIAVGILREGGNPALAALWYAGMSEQEIRRLSSELEQSLGAPSGHPSPRQVAIELSPCEAAVLELAELEADQLEDSYLGTDHILLAMLRSIDAVTQQFAQRGMSVEKYYDAVQSVRRGDPPPTTQSAI